MTESPFDERGAGTAARARRQPGGDFEFIAANVVRRLTGARVILQDDGSKPAMPDLRIERSDGSVIYAEVVTDFDPSYAQLFAELLKSGGQIPMRVEDLRSDRIWFLTVTGSFQVARLRWSVTTALTKLAAAGQLYEVAAEFEPRVPSGQRAEVVELVALGVVGLFSRPTNPGEPGAVLIYPDGVSGPVDPDWPAFLGWLESRLASEQWADVRRKLAATGAAERHVFVGVTFSFGEAFFALACEHSTLPPRAPRLPPEITHLWVMPVLGLGRCLTWSSESGWIDAARHWQGDN